MLSSGLIFRPPSSNTWVGDGVVSTFIIHVDGLFTLVSDGMFAILVPVSLSPLIITLLWAEYRTKKLGLIKAIEPLSDDHQDVLGGADDTLLRRLRRTAVQLDVVGLILLGTAISLILLPLTLSQTVNGQWKNGNCCLLAVGH